MVDFTVYPAIDLRQGRVVRLHQGDPGRETAYSEDPVAVARGWLQAGARWVHVVNLDGAFGQGGAANLHALEALVATGAQVQFGGGLRSPAQVQIILELGVSRVLLGTLAAEQPDLVRDLVARHGADRVAVSIDARKGRVRTHGWLQEAGVDPLDLARELRAQGVAVAVVTDIGRDGTERGLNLDLARRVARGSGLAVIAAGGVNSLEDVRQARGAGLAGVIIGRALYEGQITLKEALRC